MPSETYLKSQDTESLPNSASQPALVLRIRGIGNLCSFKNHRRAIRRGSSLGLITDPKIKQRQENLKAAIVSALRLALTQSTDATSMGSRPASSMRSLLPEDDCWVQVPELIVTGELVAPGEEGCDIEITRLSD